MLTLVTLAEQTGGESSVATVTAAIIAAAAALLGSFLTYWYGSQTLREQRVTQRRRQLNVALRDLLRPLYSRLLAMQALSRVLFAGKPKGFRTLEYLLDPERYTVDGQSGLKLSDSDHALLTEIVTLGTEIETLIRTKGSLVDDPVLLQEYTPDPDKTDIPVEPIKGMGLFPILIAHLRILRLAHAGSLKSDPDRFKAFVYPREINLKVFEAMKRTEHELNRLG